MSLFFNDIFNNIPEFLYISEVCLLLLAAIATRSSLNANELTKSITDLSIISLMFVAIGYIMATQIPTVSANFLLKQSPLINSLKILVVLFSLAILVVSKSYYITRNITAFEIPVVLMFSILGILTVIGSNDLLLTYLALEMQSLSIYTLVASKTNSNLSAEAGLNYFILGSFVSGFILYGISSIYLVTGTTNISALRLILTDTDITGSNVLVLGLVMLIIGMLFKLSAAPMHNWTPDVFDGAPTIITLFVSTVPKLAAFYLIINILYGIYPTFIRCWSVILLASGVMSLIVGCLGGLYQTKIKRLLAYSTINNVGFILLGLSLGKQIGLEVSYTYMLIYIALGIGIFATIVLFAKNKNNKELVYNRELSQIFLASPVIASALMLILFSLVGIPPFAGFFSKFLILLALVNNNMSAIAIFAVIAAVATSVYYIRLVRITFFSTPVWNPAFHKLDEAVVLMIYLALVFNVFFFLNVEIVLKFIHIVCIYV